MKKIKTFKELTKDFYYVNQNINDNQFPWPKDVDITGYKVIKMEKSFSSQEAMERIQEEGCRPATIQELILVVHAHPELFPDGQRTSLIAFGTEYLDSDGHRRVPLVRRFSGGDREFDLGFFELGWGGDYCLLCFCDSKSFKPKKLKKADLDSLTLEQAIRYNLKKENKESQTMSKVKFTGYVWTYYPQYGQGYLKMSEEKIHRSVPLIEGKIVIDLDKDSKVVGVEVLE